MADIISSPATLQESPESVPAKLTAEPTLDPVVNTLLSSEEGIPSLTHLEDWLDTPTVEDLLNLSTRTLQYYRSAHLFPFLKIGNKIYYKRADIEAFLEARYAAQNPQKGGCL